MKLKVFVSLLAVIVTLVIILIVSNVFKQKSDDNNLTVSDREEICTSEFISETTENPTEDSFHTDKEPFRQVSDFPNRDLRITEIHSDYFCAEPADPFNWEAIIYGSLSDEWCVDDVVVCECRNIIEYYDRNTPLYKAELISIKASDWQPSSAPLKPVIYLYPEKETVVNVKLSYNGIFTCTYPAYNDGWRVTASPDGTLTDSNGQTYNYLYWEGEDHTEYDFSKGFCVKGSDTTAFLEDALSKLGLTRKEANEFIVFWLPLMEDNPYNIITFQGDAYTDAAKLQISPSPDTVIRVFMAWKPTDSFVELPSQELSSPERNGFTVVEWGGAKIS